MFPPMLSKQAILDAVRGRIAADLASLMQSQRQTQAGAVHAESRQEDDKDTRAIEASYLARGLAERVEHLRLAATALGALRPRPCSPEDEIEVGALVTLASTTGQSHYIILPIAGGLRVQIDGIEVTCVTPTAPLGRALIGSMLDEEVEVESPHGLQRYEIVAVG